MSFKLRKEKDCLNCGHVVEENFCPQCGQENIVVKEDALHMITHSISDYFHFEHKFFGTLKPLLLKPGKLTQQYIDGKRVSFIHPIRLYIFVSIVFFLVVLGSKNKAEKSNNKENAVAATAIPKSKLDSVQSEKIKKAEEALKYIPTDGGLRDSALKEAIAEIKKDTSTSSQDIEFSKSKNNIFGSNWTTKDTTLLAYETNQAALPKKDRDGFIEHFFIKRNLELNKYPNPLEKFTEDLMHNIPKMMFLLLPLFALILKLVYLRKDKFYYEHLIYSFHVHSAIFLSILFTMLLQWIFGFIANLSNWLAFACTIYIIWYIYRSLRTFYGGTRWVTIFKLFFLGLAYNVVLLICFILVIAVSFATL
jgi:hypothetical protein